MKCPVCEQEAKDITSRSFDGIAVRCAACGDFEISNTLVATGIFAALDRPMRIGTLENAKCAVVPGKLPFIRSFCY
jgi:hypothetical protein